ncbi:MAG: DMT family transporter, partial [Anaerolineales bacterium]|nr:DMT family transporter [Anaerolineales bacterium]
GTAVPMTAIVTSLQYLSSGIASVLVTTNPALTVLMAHFLLSDERLTTRKAMGVGLALAGAAVLALSGESGLPDVNAANPIGYILMFIAMIAGSGMTIYARKYMNDMDAFDVASIRMVVAALAVMPLSVLWVGLDLQAVTGQGYFALSYAALIGTFAGMLLAFYNIQRFGATAAAMTSYIVPMVAVVGGSLFLSEQITPVMLVGMALIAAGIAILNQRQGG